MASRGTQSSLVPTTTTLAKHSTTYINRWGGFPIPHRDALNWANHIRNKDGRRTLTDEPRDSGRIMHTIEPLIEAAGGVACYPHGQIVAGKPYESYLIVTQWEEGEWRRIDGVLEPGAHLVEGEREAISKELLGREGITHGPFETCFASW